MTKKIYAKPFLKWAGGKTQLIGQIESRLPLTIKSNQFTYIEPFIGSGAVLFWMLNNFPNVKKAVINDINSDLINVYKIIATQPTQLIEVLKEFQEEYYEAESDEEEKKEYYYVKRHLYNERSETPIIRAALFIFLNRTCFNGLYRVNKKNHFNVPIGSYERPIICDEQNILAVSEVLQNIEILNDDFEETLNFAEGNSFFYLDPPYKPLNETSSFNSYAENDFDDNEQKRLKTFCIKLDSLGYKWMLSNCDAKGENLDQGFFETEYSDFNISKVNANRFINAIPEKRGKLTEILITNYAIENDLPLLKLVNQNSYL